MFVGQLFRIPLVAVALTVLLAGNAANAQLAPSDCDLANKCNTGIGGQWEWVLSAGAETGDNCDGFFWDMVPKSPAGTQPKTLTFDLRHRKRCHPKAAEIPFNPPSAVTLTAGTFEAEDQKAGYFKIKHPSLARHEDLYVWQVFVPKSGNGTVKALPKHHKKGLLPHWSYDPKGTTIRLTVIATYKSDADKTVVDDQKRHGPISPQKLPRSGRNTESGIISPKGIVHQSGCCAVSSKIVIRLGMNLFDDAPLDWKCIF